MKITVQFESLEEFQKFIGAAGEVAEEKKEKKPLTSKELNASAQKTADIINAAEAKEEAEKKAKAEKPKKEEVPFDENKKEEDKTDYAALRVECRKVLAELNKATGKNTASELIKKRGAEKLTGVRDTDLEGLMAEAREALKDAE